MDNMATVVGAFVAVIGGFLAVAKIMLKQASKDREADRKERKELSEAITLMAASSAKVAVATETGLARVANETAKGSAEAKQRNGHLAELILQSTENTKLIADGATTQIVAAVQNVKTQNV